jgi:hypothetical protein
MATKTNLFIDQGTTFITTVIAKYSNGDVIDLNNMDYSFTLELDIGYDI